MNSFGGDWTEQKIEILVKYAQAYLHIMKKHTNWKLLYFDGFAGSGFISNDKYTGNEITIGAARRIIEIEEPISFKEFYFVENNSKNLELLKKNTVDIYPDKTIHLIDEDCNIKLKGLAEFLISEKGKNYKVLAYLDPCGMQLEWSSIECLTNLSIDIWILVPTGMGVNRLLKKDGQISDAWLDRLNVFLGLGKEEIIEYFYKEISELALFGEESHLHKELNTIEKSAELYQIRLREVFKYVSNTFALKNSANSTMYHFLMASNNKNAVKIANDIINKYN